MNCTTSFTNDLFSILCVPCEAVIWEQENCNVSKGFVTALKPLDFVHRGQSSTPTLPDLRPF